MFKFATIFIVCLSLLLTLSSAAHVCRSKDCSDIVGEYMVKDNRGSAKKIHDRVHEDFREEARVKRIDILRRERTSA